MIEFFISRSRTGRQPVVHGAILQDRADYHRWRVYWAGQSGGEGQHRANLLTPPPLPAVGVLIDGQPALYVYAGEAPGLVAGMLQLNVQIPANAQSGDLQILVSIGEHTSQNGVTVSVR